MARSGGKNADEKGRALETAVELIEGHILRAFPAYEDKTFHIATRKRVKAGAVLHEVDVWVDIDLGRGYSSRVIFECKNWKKAVGKNDITVFAEKIRAVQAQRGFFVARRFSKYARAQAKLDGRIDLLEFAEFPSTGIDDVSPRTAIAIENERATITFIEKLGAIKSRPLDVASVISIRDGGSIDLKKFSDEWVFDVAQRRGIEVDIESKPGGTVVQIDVDDVRRYVPGELEIDGKCYEEAKLHLTATLRVIAPRVVTRFDVRTRGRVTFLEPFNVSEIGVEMHLLDGPG